MSRESFLEGLRDLERYEKPGSAAAQLREVEDEVAVLLTRGYTQKQLWAALDASGLKMSFNAFKSALYRMQTDAERMQKDSHGVETCPHCGKSLLEAEALAGRPGVEQAGGQTAGLQGADRGALPAAPDVASATDPDGNSAHSSFADTFMDRQSFDAGRRWK